ncbi:ABC transporter permease, partial [Burkholderia pseudomallei]
MPSQAAPASGRVLALREFWATVSRNLGAVGAGIVVLALVAVALLAPVLAPHSPIDHYRDYVKIPPAWLSGCNWQFVLGT